MASTSRSTWASKASNELHNLQGLEQELDLQLEEARELKQSLELNLEYDTALLSEMTSEADAPSHDTCLARCLEKLPQKQGKTAVSNSSRSPVRNEAQSDITEKRERDCDNNAAGKQVTSMQKEETDDTKRQKKLGGSSSKSSSSSSSPSSSHKPTATVTRPQPSNQTSAETAGVSALDGTIERNDPGE